MPDHTDYFSVHHTEWEQSPYRWRIPTSAAVWWTKQALKAINARMENINPISNLEEMEYAKKARDALQKALKEIQFIGNIKP